MSGGARQGAMKLGEKLSPEQIEALERVRRVNAFSGWKARMVTTAEVVGGILGLIAQVVGGG